MLSSSADRVPALARLPSTPLALLLLVLLSTTVDVRADKLTEYMNSVIGQAAAHLKDLGMIAPRIYVKAVGTGGTTTVDFYRLELNGLGQLEAKQCSERRLRLQCEIPLRTLVVTGYGKMFDEKRKRPAASVAAADAAPAAATPDDPDDDAREIVVKLPVRSGEIEVQILKPGGNARVRLDGRVRFSRPQFGPPLSADASTSRAISRQVESKLAEAVDMFIEQEYLNVLESAISKVALPTN